MEKKEYVRPTIKVETLEPLRILTASDGEPEPPQQIQTMYGNSVDGWEDEE